MPAGPVPVQVQAVRARSPWAPAGSGWQPAEKQAELSVAIWAGTLAGPAWPRAETQVLAPAEMPAVLSAERKRAALIGATAALEAWERFVHWTAVQSGAVQRPAAVRAQARALRERQAAFRQVPDQAERQQPAAEPRTGRPRSARPPASSGLLPVGQGGLSVWRQLPLPGPCQAQPEERALRACPDAPVPALARPPSTD